MNRKHAWTVLPFLFLVACAGSSDGADEQSAASGAAVHSPDTELGSGSFGSGELENLEVHVEKVGGSTVVRGRLRATVVTSNGTSATPDPTTACQLTFDGVAGAGNNVSIDIVDNHGATSVGELTLSGDGATLALKETSGECQNAYSRDDLGALKFAKKGPLAAKTQGFRTVRANTAHFYDKASSTTTRTAYLVKGDSVRVLSDDVGPSRVLVVYAPLGPGARETTGFLEEDALAPLSRGVTQLLGLP